MKKSSVNTFTEGLVCDLDPINVPNNVLTDCLNGTIITYDDNEFSLQNDKGNYPLKDCKLNRFAKKYIFSFIQYIYKETDRKNRCQSVFNTVHRIVTDRIARQIKTYRQARGKS